MLEDQKKLQIFNQFQKNFFKKTGWLDSYQKRESVDQDGQPIFWYTYSAIYFLKPRLKKEFKVFEYGSGNSTLCYAKFCKEVVAIEHNQEWFDKLQKIIPDNVKLVLQKNLEKFPNEIENYSQKFDLIIVDSKERVKCVKSCLNNLSNNGVIIFDNTERNCYEEGFKLLFDNGFKRLDFFGLSPINSISQITSIFYRESNILEI